MRLIDADKLHPDRMTDKGLAISQSQIAEAETVKAVPASRIEAIKEKIKALKKRPNNTANCLSTLDKLESYIEKIEGVKTGPEPVRAYKCDPKKNTACKKTACYERGGFCELTLNPEFAKEDEA